MLLLLDSIIYYVKEKQEGRKMDKDIAAWIIEELLRRPQVPDALTTKIISNPCLSLDNTNLRLKKTLLLRSIDSQINLGSVSETILDSLEAIEQLDRANNLRITDSMIAAYCAVAFHCTVKYLWGNLRRCPVKYLEAVDRIWRVRIHGLETGKKSELVSNELRKWRDDIEGALASDSNALNRLKQRNVLHDALVITGDYVAQAFTLMGPSILQFAARAHREAKLKEAAAESEAEDCSTEGADPHIDADTAVTRGKEIQKKIELHKHKQIASRRRSKDPSCITDSEELDLDILSSETQRALKSSSMELRAMVDDPLPNALHVADTVITEMAQQDLNRETLMDKQNETVGDISNSSVDATTAEMPSNVKNHEPTVENHNKKDVDALEKDVTRPSLMERNSTAHTFEWDDAIDDSPVGRTNHAILLDSPKRKAVSPLRKYEGSKFPKRRIKKMWSVEEEDALRAGVLEFGRGNWKLILNSKRDIFVERTEVDLKDKWRNMTS